MNEDVGRTQPELTPSLRDVPNGLVGGSFNAGSRIRQHWREAESRALPGLVVSSFLAEARLHRTEQAIFLKC
jgi:hypothetical protein